VQNLVAALRERVTQIENQYQEATRARHVSATLVDPAAAVQPTKDGKSCPSLQALIVVDQNLMIVGKHVEPTSVQAGVEPALRETVAVHRARLSQGKLQTITADTNFCGLPSLQAMEKYAEQVLCPPKDPRREPFGLPITGGYFDKTAFSYDPQTREMVCPVGKTMKRRQQKALEHGQHVLVFEGVGCPSCPAHAQCTPSRIGRQVKWYEVDDKKQQMRAHLRKPENRARYAQRKQTVELVLGNMKGTLGLTRFRQRGRAAARAELGLWCLAYNVWRTLMLLPIRR
jgi:hypothetical protein